MIPTPNTQHPTPDTRPLFERLVIIGVGLIGGSVGLAAKERGIVREVIGIDRNFEALERAKERGAIDDGTSVWDDRLQNADLVLLATPISVTVTLMETLLPKISPDALVTDVGSAKGGIVITGERIFGERFIGGHPMAGSERSGIEASRADLFVGRPWAIVREHEFDSETNPHAQRLAEFVTCLGANPVFLNAKRHDETVARVSHLPHVLAYAFAGSTQAALPEELLWKLAGSSFRDFTRIAHADPELWAGIFLANREALLRTIYEFEASLETLRQALQSGNKTDLTNVLTTQRLKKE